MGNWPAGNWFILSRLQVVFRGRRYPVAFFLFVAFWQEVAVVVENRYSVVAFF